MFGSAVTTRAPSMRDAWGGYLAQQPWDHFVTLTFNKPTTVKAALGQFKTFLAPLTRELAWEPTYFVVCELGVGGGHLHLHALLDGTARLGIRSIKEAWGKRGFTQVRVYDSAKQGAFYVPKMIGMLPGEPDNYEFDNFQRTQITWRPSANWSPPQDAPRQGP